MQVLTIVRYSLRRARREKAIVLTFMGMLLAIAGFASLRSVQAGVRPKIIMDLGLSSIHWFGFIVSLVITQSLVPAEISGKGIYFALSRPITRTQYLAGKWLAVVILAGGNILAVGLVLQGAVVVLGGELDLNILRGLYCGILKVGVFTALLIFLCTVLTPLVSTFAGILAWVLTHSLDLLTSLPDILGIPVLTGPVRWAAYLLPDLSNFSLEYVLVHHHEIPLWFLGLLTAYAAAYAGFYLNLAAWALQSRDL